MARLRQWVRKVIDSVRPSGPEDEMQREVASHLRLLQDEFVLKGMNEDEAWWAAKRAYGTPELAKELHRDARAFIWLEQLRQDLRYMLRQSRLSPAFTLVAVLSLAFGIGANTSIFSVIDSLLLRSLPVHDADQLIQVDSVNRKNVQTLRGFSYPGYQLMKAASGRVLTGLFAYGSTDTSSSIYSALAKSNVVYAGNAAIAKGMLVSAEMYSVLGVRPAAGRLLVASDDLVKGGSPVVVLAYSYWQERFGGDARIVGKTLVVNRVPLTVVGVTPSEFRGVELDYAPDFTVPLSMADALKLESLENHNAWWLSVLGRKKSGVNNSEVEAALRPAFRHVIADLLQATPIEMLSEIRGLVSGLALKITPARQGASAAVRAELARSFGYLMAMVIVLLCIACVNIANLVLARTAHRDREIRLRLAVGASKARVVRQLVTETLALAFIGGILAMPCAWFGPALLRMFSSHSVVASIDFRPDWRVFGFAFTVAVICGVFLGVVPLMQITERRLSRSQGSKASDLLMVPQIALALMLAVGAGLLVRSFQNIRHVDPGFRPDGVLAFVVTHSSLRYTGAGELQFYNDLNTQLAHLPGALSVSFAKSEPGSSEVGTFVRISGEPPPRQNEPVSANIVGSGYFRTVGIDLMTGRDFDAHNFVAEGQVGVVNESFARRYFKMHTPIGKSFSLLGDNKNTIRIVGVVKDVKEHGLLQPAPMMIYLPYRQGASGDLTFFVRTQGDPFALLPAVRQVLKRLDPTLPLSDVKTLVFALQNSVSREQVLAQLSSLMGLTALALASVGLYGVIAYRVSRETKAIAIRMALGAKSTAILWSVFRRVLVILGGGVGLGLIGVFSLGPLLESLLFGLSPNDPVIIGLAAGTLVLAAIVAAYVPARRAASVDPAIALRYE